MFTVDIEYSTSNDLSETANSKRCIRVKNKNTSLNDTKIGSTIGGSYSYGFATDPKNDILPEAAKPLPKTSIKPGSSSSSKTS